MKDKRFNNTDGLQPIDAGGDDKWHEESNDTVCSDDKYMVAGHQPSTFHDVYSDSDQDTEIKYV